MEPSAEMAGDVISNHVDELTADKTVGKMPTKAEIEALDLDRVVLVTVENGIGFFKVAEKIVTPAGWIWGQAVKEKILVQFSMIGVKIEEEGVAVEAPQTPLEGISIEAPQTPLSSPVDALSETAKVESPTPVFPSHQEKWTPPTHFLEKFADMEAQLASVMKEIEEHKLQLSLATAQSSTPSATIGSRISPSKFAAGPAVLSFGQAVQEEFFNFDRSTLKKVLRSEE
jgi:hypothetical protein